ncbi:uncharacterized protein LOC125268125 [Megalobrama amblycephala]|uniref:uncharacterized protein LOC125268125 n=1 Tax=Megalobrama amblycephala TaxID=75352 RepID=UPI002013E9A2|nr:uncharacterized protein LOC125268125 [Megalobrama amblycephala]
MTIAEVEAAKTGSQEGCFMINISTHKTNQAFGAAQLALSGEEYGWLADFLDMRPYLVGGEHAHYFFFTSKPSSCKNLNQYFQEAWAGMGLPGSPTFTDIRTSIASHAKNLHTSGDRQKVAQFMCHDTSTADRFYALNLDARQAAEHCRLFEVAVEGEDAAPGSPKAEKRPKGEKAGKEFGQAPGTYHQPAHLLQPVALWQPVGGATPGGIRFRDDYAVQAAQTGHAKEEGIPSGSPITPEADDAAEGCQEGTETNSFLLNFYLPFFYCSVYCVLVFFLCFFIVE